MLTCLSLQDWAKPGPYDQPMVNTLRRKKDKESPAVVDTNGSVSNDSSSVSISTSGPAPTVLQTSASVEEKNRTVAASLKVSLSVILFLFPAAALCRNVINTACLHLDNLDLSQTVFLGFFCGCLVSLFSKAHSIPLCCASLGTVLLYLYYYLSAPLVDSSHANKSLLIMVCEKLLSDLALL